MSTDLPSYGSGKLDSYLLGMIEELTLTSLKLFVFLGVKS